MITQEQIDGFKKDLQIWYEDYVKDDCSGEWEEQLSEVFEAGYGKSWQSCFQD